MVWCGTRWSYTLWSVKENTNSLETGGLAGALELIALGGWCSGAPRWSTSWCFWCWNSSQLRTKMEGWCSQTGSTRSTKTPKLGGGPAWWCWYSGCRTGTAGEGRWSGASGAGTLTCTPSVCAQHPSVHTRPLLWASTLLTLKLSWWNMQQRCTNKGSVQVIEIEHSGHDPTPLCVRHHSAPSLNLTCRPVSGRSSHLWFQFQSVGLTQSTWFGARPRSNQWECFIKASVLTCTRAWQAVTSICKSSCAV